MKYKPKSHEMLSRYMRGDPAVTLDDVKAAEKEDRIQYYITKYSFGNKILGSIIRISVKVFDFFFLE